MEHIGDLIHQEFGASAPARIRRSGEKAKIIKMPRTARTPDEYTWHCVKGTTGDYWGLKIAYRGCGVVPPLEIRPGHYVRRSCNCELEALAAKKQEAKLAAWERNEIYQTFQLWGGASLAHLTFDNFIRERNADAYDLALAYAQSLFGTLILHGGFGLGKTHLLASVCNYLRSQGISSTFVTAPKFFAVIQERIALRDSITPIINRAIATPLMVFDDVDKAKWSEWREELYFQIIDERVKRDLPTAVSLNRLDALAELTGGAVASRLSIGQAAIELHGADFRKNL